MKLNKHFTLTSDNRATVMPVIGDYLRGLDLEKPHEVIVREQKSKRSIEQNARLHTIIGLCAKESGYSIEQMKQTFKMEFMEPVEWIGYKEMQVPIFKSTAAMSVAELTNFMEKVENLAAEWYSVILPAREL